MVVVLHPPHPFSMPPDEGQAAAYELEQLQISRNTEGSLRSRASSVISTGTKFSFSTLPQGTYHIDGVLEGSQSSSSSGGNDTPRSNAARPGSLYSVRSIATSLPPYEGHAPSDTALAAVVPEGGQVATTQVTTPGTDSSQPPTPSTLDPENSLSMHYGRVVRHIDETHRRQVARIMQAHEQELAAMRDAIDKAYRKEFKAKDREMERVRAEAADDMAALEESKVRELDCIRDEGEAKVAALEGEMEAVKRECEEVVGRLKWEAEEREEEMREGFEKAVEKACNAIEDVWEGRWNDRSKLAVEEARRHVEDRDEEWLKMIDRKHPELVEEMRLAMNVAERRRGKSKEH